MEKNAAACAMEWSIELEKTLRSNNPGRAVEAIVKIGSRLDQWSREPEPTVAVYNMFGLVAGEDKLFANTILLRLADAFKLGNKHIRLSIARVFLSLLRHRGQGKRSKHYRWILSKAMLQDHLELLSRVKIVFDSGDAQSRALSLVLFGCWADFAKESAHIRYLILSSLVSPNLLEVKASLFAAACFSELADDFACVVLEMLRKLMTPSSPSDVRLAGARVFAKLGCSYSVAKKAYKTALEMVSESSEEEFLAAMLVSLSRFVSKSILLSSEQVNLLCLFLSPEKPIRIQGTALRCLRFLFRKGVYPFANGACIVRALVSALDDNGLPSAIEYDALWILHKILSYMLAHPQFPDMIEFPKLFIVIKNASQSPVRSNSLLAFRIMANLSMKLAGKMEIGFGDWSFSFLPSQVISLIMDQTILLVKQLVGPDQTNSEVSQVQDLLDLLLLMTREHSDLDVLVLERIGSFVEFFLNLYRNFKNMQQAEMMDLTGDKSDGISLKLLFIICRFVSFCIDHLNQADSITAGVFDKVKLLVDCICQTNLFDCNTYTFYSLLLHSKFVLGCVVNEGKETCNSDTLSGLTIRKYAVEHEKFSLECGKKLLSQKDNWLAYKAGTYAACHGAWFTASFIFAQLVTKVHSDTCYCWLKSLVQFALSERRIQLLLLTEQGSGLVDRIEEEKIYVMFGTNHLHQISQHATENITEPSYEEILEAYNCLSASAETLEAAVTTERTFCFQRWFLYLRAKVIGTVGNILKLLGTISFDHLGSGEHVEFENNLLNSLQDYTRISSSLKRMALEFDLIITSFNVMDSISSKIISELALSCSLLAFCTGFAVFVPQNSATLKTDPKSCGNGLNAMLLQNLLGRLYPIDCELSKNFAKLSEASGVPKNGLHFQSRNQILDFGYEARDVLSLCNYALSGIVCLQNTEERLNEETILNVIKDGILLLSNILMKWLQLPFRIPKYFFKVRPCVRSELFAIEANTRKRDPISTLQGSHLSLDLCIQLRHVPPDLPVQLTNLYCILSCRLSSQETRTTGENRKQQNYRPWENDDLVEMHDKLLWYVTECSSNKSNVGKRGCIDDGNSGGLARAFVCFELNHTGQGFSRCLLDVSCFPVGCYKIDWYSCCVDSQGSYWTPLPLHAGPVFSIQ